jgi:glycine/D-amino acid oxidase-like deaminating enzyme
MSRPTRIVICGGGAIGAAIAWFLSRRGTAPIVIERHAVGGAASGKSGGFLALDWCRGTPLDRLARRSFALHGELADALGNPWLYRRLETYGGHAAENDTVRKPGPRPWLSGRVNLTGQLGSPQTTAVLEPRAFTTGLMRAAEAEGAELRHGTVVDLARGPTGAVSGVALESGEIVEGDAVVVAMGPWSILATRWLPLPAVFGYKGHSLVFQTGEAIPAEALFLEYEEDSGEILTPRALCAHRWHDLGVRGLERRAAAHRSRPSRGRRRRACAAGGDVPSHLAGPRRGADPGAPSLFSPCHRGWLAADGSGAGRGRRLRGDGSQRLGHAQRAGDR